MIRFLKLCRNLLIIILLFFIGVLIADKYALRTNIVRLHVVANSDSASDQSEKLLVRDAVLRIVQDNVKDVEDPQEVRQYILQSLPEIESAANRVLKLSGSKHCATVNFTEESFDIRHYDTFSLPSGVYHSLRVKIGDAVGKNWWCVVFPALCVPDNYTDFRSVAVASGFSDELTDTLADNDGYNIRFFLLDYLGKIENKFLFS